MLRRLIEVISADPALIMADAAAKATVLLALAAVAAFALHLASAAVRHRLWGLSLAGLVALIPLSWAVPGWRLPVLSPSVAWLLTPWASGTEDAERADLGTVRHAVADGPGTGPGLATKLSDTDRAPDDPLRPGPAGVAREGPGLARWAITDLGLLWSLGFLAAGMSAFAGILRNARQRRRSPEIIDQSWVALLDGLARELGIGRRVELRMSPASLIPATWGIMRPVILLPQSGLQWPEPTRRVVLLHELAHVARWDVVFLMIGRLAAGAFWFHPLAWYALHRLRVECEHACDDLVVRAGVRRTDYARKLVELARSLRGASLAMAVPMARRSSLERRIMAMFDERRSHRPLNPRSGMTLFGGALIVLASLAACRLGPSASAQQAGPDRRLPAAPDPTPAPGSPLAKPRDDSGAGPATHPITVTGRALDPDGKPIAGADVYLASQRAAYRRIAKTTTGADGSYEFRNVPLPIQRADPNKVGGRDTGAFQVFGRAEGFGFAWRPQKWFFPRPKPSNITYEPERLDPPSRYEAGDPIVLDLRFSPAATFSGRVVDDRGNPLRDVRLEIRNCESPGFVDNVFRGWTFDSLNERDTVPPSMKIRTTDADGRFAFAGLPEGYLFRIDVRAEGFPSRWIYAATTREPLPDEDGAPVLMGDVELVLKTPLGVPIVAVYGDTGKPAPRVLVSVAQGLVNTSQTTDDRGRVTLRIPSGNYRLQLLPERGTPYLVTEDRLDVGANPPAEPIVKSIRPAAIIEVTVVDAETGKGLPDVDLWRQAGREGGREEVYFRSWEVATRIAHVDRPRTDANGTLRALVEPGLYRFGIAHNFSPRFYSPVEPQDKEVECRAGETARLRFSMQRTR